jgi:hypothetical protein
MEKSKPNVFIASSVEGLAVAEAINSNLDHDTFNTLWRTGTFRLGSSVIEDLVKKSSAVDFAVFVFTPDDATTIRMESAQVVRDNVLFELGLFIGALGKERCYVVRPRNVEMHLPSDLLGMITADYVSDRPDGDVASALNAACKLIKDEIKRHGPIRSSTVFSIGNANQRIANPPQYRLSQSDLNVLAECVHSFTNSPHGLGFHSLSNALMEPDNVVSLSLIKLVKLGYIDKSVETSNHDGEPYYAYRITDDGLDIFVKNEEAYTDTSKVQILDDKIPF